MSDWLRDEFNRRTGRSVTPEIPEDADTFTHAAMSAGVPADLVDVARRIVPNAAGLSGAALTSALGKAIEDRPGLVADGYSPPPQLDGLEGGVRTRSEPEEESIGTRMDRAIRGRTGRYTVSPQRYAPNGIDITER